MLRQVFPLSSDDEAALSSCRLLLDAEVGDVHRVPVPFWTGLMVARADGEEVRNPELLETHRNMSNTFFRCEALSHVIAMVVGRDRFVALSPALAHADVGRFDIASDLQVLESWSRSMEICSALAEAA